MSDRLVNSALQTERLIGGPHRQVSLNLVEIKMSIRLC